MTVDPKTLFFPNKAIRQDNKTFFAGRRDLLLAACRRIGRDDYSAVIYGDRGVGKTSFAWQLLELLSADRAVFQQSIPLINQELIANVPRCKCIWLQCQRYMDNIEGVLLSLLKESIREHSFNTEFLEVYQSEKLNEKFQRKYGFDLGIVSAEILFTDDNLSKSSSSPDFNYKSQKARIQGFFRDVVDACKNLHPNQPIVVFLDEFDSLPDRTGVGQLIKAAADDVNFVIIGIADNIDEIIEDHLSAERKLTDSKYIIPRLNPDEINFIFDKAEQVANREVIFEQDFRDEVVFKSYGYPFLIQQFGYFATQAALDDINPSQNPLRVEVKFLQEAITRIFRNRQESKLFSPLVETLQSDKKAKKEILRIVADSPDYVSIEKIKSQVEGRLRQHVKVNIDSLVDTGILKPTDKGDRLRFRDPEARILTQLHFGSQESNH